jgi:hypothetical protein
MERLIITPKTKIYELLEAYPELEEILIDAAPDFRKLRNPLLRNTIARITSISQAAIIGKLNVGELVNKLREAVGQDNIVKLEVSGANYNTTQPDWFKASSIVTIIDIKEILNRGEQPVFEVLAAIKALGKNEILKITSPFIPAPLIDKTLSLGYKHWLNKLKEDEFEVFFVR